jgi:hypothetical protein
MKIFLIAPQSVILSSVLLAGILFAGLAASVDAADETACRVVQEGTHVELRSPFFVFQLDTRSGLCAETWHNRLTGRTISLGNGPELDVDIGPLGGPLQTPHWEVTVLPPPTPRGSGNGEAVFRLVSKEPALSAQVTYRWDSKEPVLRKFVTISNTGDKKIHLLNVRQGTYRTDARLSDRERGFPVYYNDEFFMSLAHPAGWATAKDRTVSLRQYPATTLARGAAFECMEAVYGVGQRGEARKTFLAHVRSRMRRVVHGHDKPYAIFDNFSSWPSGDYNWGDFVNAEGYKNYLNTEAYMLHSLDLLARSQKATGCRFDICNIHFWVDTAGDLKQWDPKRFPNGIKKIRPILDSMKVAPGLWIDSCWTLWSIGDNPATKPSLSDNPSFFCRASEPIKSMYRAAFLDHIRKEGIRLLKFDSLSNCLVCNNPKHDHLPGFYSTEAIENSVAEFYDDLGKECPDVFLMLYWGHRSPWWLLHGDTLFDSGAGIEGSAPCSCPAPYARDSVTQKLDQAQWLSCDIPPLGKDSLGIWLSN